MHQQVISVSVSVKDTDVFLAMANLLKRAAQKLGDNPPDSEWFRDFYLITGEHMVLTEEGWQAGAEKQSLIDEYGADYIQDEVNVPTKEESEATR